jgi:hypothetical protein
VASEANWEATGIELLPIGAILVKARLLASSVSIPDFQDSLKRLRTVSLLNPGLLGQRGSKTSLGRNSYECGIISVKIN